MPLDAGLFLAFPVAEDAARLAAGVCFLIVDGRAAVVVMGGVATFVTDCCCGAVAGRWNGSSRRGGKGDESIIVVGSKNGGKPRLLILALDSTDPVLSAGRDVACPELWMLRMLVVCGGGIGV